MDDYIDKAYSAFCVPKPSEREKGVLYMHPTYSKEYYEGLDAIEVYGVRFVREKRCSNISGSQKGFVCSECGWGDLTEPSPLVIGACYDLLKEGPVRCPRCGTKVVPSDASELPS